MVIGVSTRKLGFALIACSLVGCGEDDPGSATTEGTDSVSTTGSTDVTTGNTGATGTTGMDTDGDEPTPMPDVGDLATGIKITDIGINQAIQTELVTAGAFVGPGSRTAVVVGNRPGLIQAFYETDPAFSARMIEARLTLKIGDKLEVLTDTQMVSGPSSGPGSLTGGFSWTVNAEQLPGNVEFSVGLFEVSGPGPEAAMGARFPESGQRPLEPDGSDLTFDVVFIPALNCGTPFEWSDTLKGHLEGMAFNMFPVSKVNATFHEPIAAGCQDISAASSLRAQEALGPSYFYQMVYDENQSNCGGGYAWLIGADMAGDRSSWAGAFCWNMDWSNSPHELGHNLGRNHTWSDPAYPGDGGSGTRSTWGYGVGPGTMPQEGGDMMGRFQDPAGYYDIMSYTNPKWISAHNYNEMFVVLLAINSWAGPGAEDELAEYYATRSIRGIMDADGNMDFHLQYGHPTLSREAEEGNDYVAFHSARNMAPRPSPVQPGYGIGEGGAGGDHGPELRAVTIPLPEDWESRGIDRFTLSLDGAEYEVEMADVSKQLAPPPRAYSATH